MIVLERGGGKMDPARSAATRGGFGCPTRHAESGSALLIVLAFILILAVVLTAFLSSSQRALQQSESSSTILKTQMLGEVATTAVIDDLREEMRAGADTYPADGEIMKVSRPWAMVPSRVLKEQGMLANPAFANLVKQSASGQRFFPDKLPDGSSYSGTATSRASAANTITPSKNQRVISTERWEKPRLIGSGTGQTKFSTAQTPDWIYIDRSGAKVDGASIANAASKLPTNAEYVLGRFAYNIYRVDGLLDINVAGFRPDDAAGAVSKGSLAWADLRALPGLDGDNDVRALVDWRNKLSKADYPAMIAGLTSTSPPDAMPGAWGEPGGFLESYTDGSQTDNRFFSRQDLLKFFSHQFGENSPQSSALFCLTTFSADLNQPSFRPDPNRPKIERAASGGGNDAFGDEGTAPDKQINPALFAVLGADGKPVVKSRFPLDRLKYVLPDPAAPAKVAEYFGLTWDQDSKFWTYADGDAIKRLHEIQGREPNMIELLKAGIGIGSLGGQFSVDEKLGSPRQIGGRDASINYQVMRIAAAIIDQYDTDSYPTRIKFGSYVISGVENLPYLYGMRIAAYRQTQLDPSTAVKTTSPGYPSAAETTYPLYRSVIMLQPIIWNPHATQATSTGVPTKFRVTAASGLDIRPGARRAWWTGSTSTAYRSDWPSKTGDFRDADTPIAFSAGQDYITFSVSSNPSAKFSFREPYTLKSPNYPPGSDAIAHGSSGDFSEPTLSILEQIDQDPAKTDERTDRAIGFRAGWAWSGPYEQGPTPYWLQEGQVATNGIDIELQYESPNGWVTYDSIEKFNAAYPYRQGRISSGAENPVAMRFHMRVDPRVDRYGLKSSLFLTGSGVTGVAYPQGLTMRPGTDPGYNTSAGWTNNTDTPDVGDLLSRFNFHVPANNPPLGQLSENRSSGLWYEDPDGVVRLAMGGLSSGVNGLPMVTGNYASRPVVLNRPFRSVAELGYVLRDQPWKQLDFFSPESADAALLDLFCLYEPAETTSEPVVAGRVNLNTPREEVIEAMLRGVELQDGVALDAAQANSLAKALVEWTSSTDIRKGPLRNRSELVGKFVSGTTYSGFSSKLTDVLNSTDGAVPLRRQNILRALVDPGTARTWTFLIDLIVQDGRFGTANTAAEDFMVRGERRLWVHVSIDRFTGEVISERVEEVHE